MRLLFTCEHGGARVPAQYRHLFTAQAARAALESHRGSDIGALRLARSLSSALAAPLYSSSATRLLVDLNRSLGHPQLFSEFSKCLGVAERQRLLERHYLPHRDRVEAWVEQQLREGSQVLHVGVHSFAPRVSGDLRTADVGLLYDPSHAPERALAARWKSELSSLDEDLRVRRNYPFLGKSDGFVTALRRRFGAAAYLGFELEVNQRLLETREGARRTATSIERSIALLIAK